MGRLPTTECTYLPTCWIWQMSLHGATGYAPGLSAPRSPISVLAPDFLGGIPSANSKVLVFLPTFLLQGRGGQRLRAMRTPVCYTAKT